MTRHNKTAVLALVAALAVGGFVAAVTGDVIIGVAVGAALFALGRSVATGHAGRA